MHGTIANEVLKESMIQKAMISPTLKNSCVEGILQIDNAFDMVMTNLYE